MGHPWICGEDRQRQEQMRGSFLPSFPFGKLRVRMTNLASWMSTADFARGHVLGFLGGRMGGEPGLLIVDEVSGFFADVADGLEG